MYFYICPGIRQWFPLRNTIKGRKHRIELTCGIEVQLRFTSSETRRNIVNIGRSTGWRPHNQHIELNNEAWLSPHQVSHVGGMGGCRLNVIIDRVWIPSDVIEECFPCFRELKRDPGSMRVYARYKLYDQGINHYHILALHLNLLSALHFG